MASIENNETLFVRHLQAIVTHSVCNIEWRTYISALMGETALMVPFPISIRESIYFLYSKTYFFFLHFFY